MCFPRNGIHHGCFRHGIMAELVVDGILDQIKASLLSIFAEKQFLLTRVVDFDGTDSNTAKGIVRFKKIINSGTGLFHAFVVDISIEVGISISRESKSDTSVLPVLNTKVAKIGAGPQVVAPHPVAEPGNTFHQFPPDFGYIRRLRTKGMHVIQLFFGGQLGSKDSCAVFPGDHLVHYLTEVCAEQILKDLVTTLDAVGNGPEPFPF